MKIPTAPVLLCAVLGGALLAPLTAHAAPAPTPDALFESARKLQAAGETRAAFWQFLAIAGGEEAAADLARPQARIFLEALQTPPADIAPARLALLQGELHLALNQKTEALESYRRAAQLWPQLPDKSQLYPVETPNSRDDNFNFVRSRLNAPLSVGPGSHRDNWLVRRFIALEAWEDAARELERIWQIQRQLARPYRFESPFDDGQTRASQPMMMMQTQPNGFDGLGLQFAVDYAYFLKRRGQTDKALAVLREPLDIMDAAGARRYSGTPAFDSTQSLPLLWNRSVNYGLDIGRSLNAATLSSAEFARLAWGEWKAAGKGDELIASLNAQIAGGDNRARRVLALIERHRGQLDNARALELAWIEGAKFSPFASAMQRGAIEEEFGHTREAALAYEAALELPFDENSAPSPASQLEFIFRQPRTPEAQARIDVRTRLIRLYGTLDNTPRALELTLQNLEFEPAARQNLSNLALVQKRFEVADQSTRWKDWAQKHLIETDNPTERANGFWLLGNRGAALQAVEELAARAPDSYALDAWRKRFEDAHLKIEFLQTMTRAQPKVASWQLELLRAQKRTSGADEIPVLELLLKTSGTGFGKGQRDYGRRGPFITIGEQSEREANDGTRFKNPFELALRLIYLYDKSGQNASLQALALQIARGEKPFERNNWDNGSDGNGATEFGNAALALAIARADAGQRATLEKALEESPWQGARAQLRRLKSGLKAESSAPFGWAGGVAANAQVLASVNNVLSLCRDDKYIYSGHPWGVAVYDLNGKPITRVATGVPALHLARTGGALFVGGTSGLVRVGVGDWRVSIVDFAPEKSINDDLTTIVTALAVQDGKLWLGTRRDVRLFDPRTREMKVWNSETVGFDQHFTVNRFVFDGKFVWADADEGCRRFDPQSNSWRTPQLVEPSAPHHRAIHLIDIVNGQAWADVYLDDERRHRPALLDAKTLEVRPIALSGETRDGDKSKWMVNEAFSYYGSWNGQSVWGAGAPRWSFDEATQTLKPLPRDAESGELRVKIETDWPRVAMSGQWRRRFDSALICPKAYNTKLGERKIITPFWTALRLPNDTLALGAAFSVARDYTSSSWSDSRAEWGTTEFPRELSFDSGGLFLSNAASTRAISSAPRADTLGGDLVFDAVFDANRDTTWLATERGLVGVRDGKTFANLTRADGLLSNRIISGAEAGGRLFFASRWHDDGGGLMMLDPQTTLVRSFLDVGGLPNNALERIAATPSGRLELGFGTQYRRWSDYKNQRQPDGWFDPKTGAFSPLQAPIVTKQAKLSAPKSFGTLPILGGPITARQQFDGKTWLLGARGVVIVGAKPVAPAKFARIAVKTAPDARQLQLADAQKRAPKIGSLAQLQTALKDQNPFFRAQALASLLGSSLLSEAPVRARIIAQLDDSELRVRTTALALLNHLPTNVELSESERNSQIVALKRHLSDDQSVMRSWSLLSLLRLGELPAPDALRRQLATRDAASLPFGAESSIGSAGQDAFYQALAPLADAEVFALLLENPPRLIDYSYGKTVFPLLGTSLLRHPDAVPLLLAAYDAKPYQNSQRDFAQAVFQFAGKDALPLLLPALESPERVVRSNAARALGAIGDASAAPPLIDALDLESGLSRASIVWALGELKASAALETLATLYTELENAPRNSGGFLAAQSFAFNSGQYAAINARAEGDSAFAALKSLDDVAGDYARISAPTTPIDPRRDEELLSAQMILDAVAKIGPAAMGDWYRKLAASTNANARRQAAIHLAQVAQSEQNKPILRNLLSDAVTNVRLSAAVSLLELGATDGQKIILEAFADRFVGKSELLEELGRVGDASKLAFARTQIRAIADDAELSKNLRGQARALMTKLKTK